MATKTESKQSNRSRSSGGNNGGGATKRDSEGRFTSERSAFSWGGGNAGVLAGAAIAGAAVGIAANFGRKFLMQMPAAAAGDWFDALKAEHAATLAVFDKIEATNDSQTTMRTTLLMKLKYALTKHAHRGRGDHLPGAPAGQFGPRRRRSQLRARLCEDLSLRAREPAEGQPRLAGPGARFPRHARGAYPDGGRRGLPRLQAGR